METDARLGGCMLMPLAAHRLQLPFVAHEGSQGVAASEYVRILAVGSFGWSVCMPKSGSVPQ